MKIQPHMIEYHYCLFTKQNFEERALDMSATSTNGGLDRGKKGDTEEV